MDTIGGGGGGCPSSRIFRLEYEVLKMTIWAKLAVPTGSGPIKEHSFWYLLDGRISRIFSHDKLSK